MTKKNAFLDDCFEDYDDEELINKKKYSSTMIQTERSFTKSIVVEKN